MKDVPRIESEARSHHEGAGRPVQNQANVELSKPPHQAVHCHGTTMSGNAAQCADQLALDGQSNKANRV
jgi:hypothetical protein